MKKVLILLAAALVLVPGYAGPKKAQKEKKAMARFVPERSDDFVWENDYVCYRAYGKALEGNPTAPGFDVWVKTPGKLVADQRYHDELVNHKSYHKDWGNGKDCYKVAVSLGAGASAPLVGETLVYPATNYRSYEIKKDKDNKVVFILHYPEWEVNGHKVSLDKKITVTAGSYFCKCEDIYKGDFETLDIAAGLFRHTIDAEFEDSDRFALWEEASDQSIEKEDGRIGVAVYMPKADKVIKDLKANKHHTVAVKTIKPGQKVTYWFGSCWTKGDIKTADQWFQMVKGLK